MTGQVLSASIQAATNLGACNLLEQERPRRKELGTQTEVKSQSASQSRLATDLGSVCALCFRCLRQIHACHQPRSLEIVECQFISR